MFGSSKDANEAKRKGLPKATVHTLMKEVGANMVSEDAVLWMKKTLGDIAKDITTQGLKITRHGKRTKLTADDLDLAYKQMKQPKSV